MPEDVNQIIFNDFSAGWIVSDSPENGRRNGLLKMDNVELDKNGALSLTGGCAKVGSAYTYPAHSIWSRSMAGVRTDYVADTNGGVLRNGSSIITGGSTSLAAFGDAYKYILIASGALRKKDTGSGTPLNLGIVKPSAAVTLGVGTVALTTQINTGTPVYEVGTTNFVAGEYEQDLDGPDNNNIIQTDSATSTGDPWNLNELIVAGTTIAPSDDDYMLFQLNAVSALTYSQDLQFVTIDFLLQDPGSSGSQVENYYRYTWTPVDTPQYSDSVNIITRRGDYVRFGAGAVDWSTVWGVRIEIRNIAAIAATWYLNIVGGGFQYGPRGPLEYCAINVNADGAYIGKSTQSVTAVYTSPFGYYPSVTVQNPTAVDTQVNQVWVFRRGGTLDQWYRVKVVTSAWAAFNDTLSDVDALTIGITLNTNLVSINVASISDDILSIVGPIEGRWFYFTGNTMYPSDINNPDLVDVTKGVSFSNANNEKFLWAVKVSDEAVLVGTSLEVYLLTGTFQTLPDFTIDVYKRALGCKHPPISYDVTYYDGSAIYIAADGWRSITPGGISTLLIAPNTDRIYRETVQGYNSLVVGVEPAARRYPCVVAQNKLWCGIHGTGRIEVLDLTRKYWRNIDYGVGIVRVLTKASDGNIVAHVDGSGTAIGIFLRNLGIRTSLQIDGATDQPITILSPVLDGGMLRNRKDALTLKAKIRTGGANLAVAVIDEFGASTALGNLSSNTANVQEKFLNASTIPVSRTFQFSLTGSFSAFELSDITLDFEPRPAPLTYYIVRPTNYGKPSLKRTRQWPVNIDTLGNNITCTPRVDGSNLTAVVISSAEKATKTLYFDAFGTDIGLILSGGAFELYDIGRPEFLEVQPIPRLYDFVGPLPIYRFGKIARVRVMMRATGVSVPYILWVNDENVANGTLTTIAGLLNHYDFPLPKGLEGTVLSLELGSTAQTESFERYNVEVLVSRSGNDTDKQWQVLSSTEQQ